jgi:(2Fe-2S) ferredoxin
VAKCTLLDIIVNRYPGKIRAREHALCYTGDQRLLAKTGSVQSMGDKTEAKKLIIAVCYGDACKEKDGKKVRARLKELVKARDLKKSVKIKKADCFDDCENGPIVECASIPLRFRKASPDDAERILDRCLAGKPEEKPKKAPKKTAKKPAKKTAK